MEARVYARASLFARMRKIFEGHCNVLLQVVMMRFTVRLISHKETETMCVSRHPKQCSIQFGGVTLQQSDKFKYLAVSLTSDGRQNSELDIRVGKASAVMLHRSVVLKRELCTKAKLSIFRSVYVPILT